MFEPLRPARGGFLRPVGTGWFVVKFLKGNSPVGSPAIDPDVGATQTDIHRAYLFFGASGTGKTTTARILAMCLNCYSVNGDGEPCGQCQSCQAVREGSHWDILEIDGARFRGIEDVKELAFRAYLAPMGKRKVYIIDECHMLTEPAWNGMLKLLEEPPPHLVVILCTTHFEKIPDTISSRCQLYPFTKLKPDQIKQKLESICQSIGISPDPKHIQFIVEKAGGNMRSAENTLEQVCQIGTKGVRSDAEMGKEGQGEEGLGD